MVTLYDYGDTRADKRTRTAKSGKSKSRVSVAIKATPVVHDFNESRLGAGVAEAIRDVMMKEIRAITATVSASTLARRLAAKRALSSGTATPAIRKRYSGGRMGAMNPTGGDKMFNDSDRLGDGLHVRHSARTAEFTTNVPANRFTGDTAPLIDKLVQLIPSLKNPALLLRDQKVSDAVEKSVTGMITVAKNARVAKMAALRKAQANVLKSLFGLG